MNDPYVVDLGAYFCGESSVDRLHTFDLLPEPFAMDCENFSDDDDFEDFCESESEELEGEEEQGMLVLFGSGADANF